MARDAGLRCPAYSKVFATLYGLARVELSGDNVSVDMGSIMRKPQCCSSTLYFFFDVFGRIQLVDMGHLCPYSSEVREQHAYGSLNLNSFYIVDHRSGELKTWFGGGMYACHAILRLFLALSASCRNGMVLSREVRRHRTPSQTGHTQNEGESRVAKVLVVTDNESTGASF